MFLMNILNNIIIKTRKKKKKNCNNNNNIKENDNENVRNDNDNDNDDDNKEIIERLDKEFLICSRCADIYPRNYYAWTYRIKLWKYLPNPLSLLLKELNVTMKQFVKRHLSDYSALNYRQFLLKEIELQLKGEKKDKTVEEQEEGILDLYYQELLFVSHLQTNYPGFEATWQHRKFVLRYIANKRKKTFFKIDLEVRKEWESILEDQVSDLENEDLSDLNQQIRLRIALIYQIFLDEFNFEQNEQNEQTENSEQTKQKIQNQKDDQKSQIFNQNSLKKYFSFDIEMIYCQMVLLDYEVSNFHQQRSCAGSYKIWLIEFVKNNSNYTNLNPILQSAIKLMKKYDTTHKNLWKNKFKLLKNTNSDN
ncbi:protein prenyltransferase alpha subunit repeat-containing protein [Anaeramoeba flamelloides]|uniref:Protein prenyltransferase alpha subunit repeat-containing protein n=1 Tax=Anaeramoeba flamelloides TaxID=1746091 RepID=A0ABQ8XSW1_9EUKA|nr:protein prenyltransferase alpha subunit repeat-containing protein [Anaeramoeba flamelloides]